VSGKGREGGRERLSSVGILLPESHGGAGVYGWLVCVEGVRALHPTLRRGGVMSAKPCPWLPLGPFTLACGGVYVCVG
jgi:hypothetical protein